MTRNLRRLAAVLALFGLTSAQAALAAYICPIDAGKAPASAVSEHARCGPQSDPAIDGALCELHCQVTSSVPSSPAADLVVPAAAPLVVAGRSVHAPQSLRVAPARAARCARRRAPGRHPLLPPADLIPASLQHGAGPLRPRAASSFTHAEAACPIARSARNASAGHTQFSSFSRSPRSHRSRKRRTRR
ncbi:MAG: hypothetical protein IPM22_01080 [Betaproteobacteria bacterium]|nr:hypothetical protein [Betaproteobacteria bacterium]